MKKHRAIWLITGLAVTLTTLVLLTRERERSQDPRLRIHQTIDAMLKKISVDPYIEQPDTKKSIAQTAEFAKPGEIPLPETYYALALTEMDAGHFQNAETAFRRAITLNPQWSWPYDGLGILLGNYAKTKIEEAEQAYRTAIRLDPNRARTYSDLSSLLRLSGRLKEAEEMSLEALRREPENVAVRNNYGNLLVAQHKFAEAEAQYQKAIQIAPDHPKPYYNLACVYALQGKKNEALALLEQAVALAPALRTEAQNDSDFTLLRAEGRFKKIIEKKQAVGNPSPIKSDSSDR
jgi:Flp pilus assembly protein TadD